jgi:hypothetical protein
LTIVTIKVSSKTLSKFSLTKKTLIATTGLKQKEKKKKKNNRNNHFLLHCKNYIVQRNIFLIRIREINNDLPIDELTLLFGNEILNDEKNTQIFLQVQKCIQDSGCFAVSSDFPHEHNVFGIKLAQYRSLFNALYLFLNLLCKTLKYLSPLSNQ